MPTQVQIPAPFNKWLTINEATTRMGYAHAQHTRNIIKSGKIGAYVQVDESTGEITGVRVKLNMGSYEQWRVDPAACDAYRAKMAEAGTHAFGHTGVRRMTLRFSTDHYSLEEVIELLANGGDGLGDPTKGAEGDEFRWELLKSTAGQKKRKTKKAEGGEVVIASIVESLTSLDEDEDDDSDLDFDEDEEDVDDVLA